MRSTPPLLAAGPQAAGRRVSAAFDHPEPSPDAGGETALRRRPGLDEATTGVVAGLLVVAGLIHASIAPDHFREWWGFGVAFTLAALAQLGIGIAVAVSPGQRALRAAGAAAAVAIAAWALSRTVGLPFIPGRRIDESAGALDLLTVAAETVTLLLLVGAPRGLLGRRGLAAAQATGVFLIALLALAFAAGVGHD